MDNFKVDIVAKGDVALRLAVELFYAERHKVVAYRISKESGLVLYWSEHKDATTLPFKYDIEDTIRLISKWLSEQDYGPEPDHDGHKGKGFRIYNCQYGHVDDHWQAMMAVQPEWAEFGK